ncbi:unnamed protein product, partial [Polarella glacialis]
AMVGAMVLALSQVAAEETSTAPGSEAGDVHVKVVLPVEAAQALEDGGLKSVELAACVRGRVIPQVLPPGPRTVSSEQVLCLSGPLAAMQAALSAIAEPVSLLADEPWFSSWADQSHCGIKVKGLDLFVEPAVVEQAPVHSSRVVEAPVPSAAVSTPASPWRDLGEPGVLPQGVGQMAPAKVHGCREDLNPGPADISDHLGK